MLRCILIGCKKEKESALWPSRYGKSDGIGGNGCERRKWVVENLSVGR